MNILQPYFYRILVQSQYDRIEKCVLIVLKSCVQMKFDTFHHSTLTQPGLASTIGDLYPNIVPMMSQSGTSIAGPQFLVD